MLGRRRFLQAAGASTVAALLPEPAAPASQPRRTRVAVLMEPGFPSMDAAPVRPDLLGAALDGFETTYLSAVDLPGRLTPGRFDVYVNPYGSAFPKDAWPALLGYLAGGGNWVNLGGVPCAVPVVRAGAGWRAEERQADYHKRLGAVLACAVDVAGVGEWKADDTLAWTSVLAAQPAPRRVWELYYRFSSVAETPDESGSAGPTEARVRPLVSGLDAERRPVVAPFVMVDRLEREFAGGRWIFATSEGAVEPAAVRAMVEAASLGSRQLEVRTSFACYYQGERPSLDVTYRGAPREAAPYLAASCRVGVFDERGASLAQFGVMLTGSEAVASGGPVDLSGMLPNPMAPGLYRVEAVLTLPGARPVELVATTGFWVHDRELLAGGAPLGVSEDALTRNGEPFPVTGTTYMASDVHRKFLLQPNPWLWDRDFAEMKRAGINLVRTGLWTGWKTLMPRVGEFRDDALRSLDAFLLTARRHDIPVIFTFFAFLPEAWGGENPYLDPRAVEAQRTFVSLIAARYRRMNDVLWDLINEPSFCNKDHLWSCRPNYDRFERDAWAGWLRDRGQDAVALPPLEAFNENGQESGAAPASTVLEYRLFAQATFARWVREMSAALRGVGNPRQLLTIGQDEAGTRDSPNNLFLAGSLDFTCVHNWWLNDALVWDGVITKAPGKLNLIEETGVMFSGRPQGVEARWEGYARNLLERKMAMAVGPAGSGFVEWVWNSNCYMPSDNEAAIGLLRADGTAKPELDALEGVAGFVAVARRHMVGRERAPVLLVVPHSNMFSTRNTATEATRRAVRVMHYRCRTSMAAMSEYALDASAPRPRLAILPCARVLRQAAWETLLGWMEGGTVVVATGPIELDERGLPVRRLERLGIGAAASPVRAPVGRGVLLWSPLPLELSGGEEDVAALYNGALREAGIQPAFTVEGADASILVHASVYQDSVLFTLVSESDRPATLHLVPRESGATLVQPLAPQRAALLLVQRRDGRVLARYPA